MKYLICRKVGGSRGNSSTGTNFGNCTAENKIYKDSKGVQWTQQIVHGNLLVWGFEYTSTDFFDEARKICFENRYTVVLKVSEMPPEETLQSYISRGIHRDSVVTIKPYTRVDQDDYFGYEVGPDFRIRYKKL